MKINTICQYCSAGCSLELNIREGKPLVITGVEGVINTDGFICSRASNGYQHLSDPNRILQPLLKTSTGFQQISFEDAFLMIEEHLRAVQPDENFFFAGARLSNEELYLLQKIARVGEGTNNLASFHYLGRGTGYLHNTKSNIPVAELLATQVIYLLGDSLPSINPYIWHVVQQAKREENIKIVWVSVSGEGVIKSFADETIVVQSLYSFLKLINRHLIENEQNNTFFTDEICLDFASYKEGLLSEDNQLHLQNAGIDHAVVETVVKDLLSSGKEVFLFTEAELSGNACREVHHLAMLTGKMGRVADGIIAIKEEANAQGLIDMGIHPEYGQGGVPVDDEDFLEKAQTYWGIDQLPAKVLSDPDSVLKTQPKNIFIFGEEVIEEASNNKDLITKSITDASFSIVQDFTMTPTARLADLILPSTYLFETGGTYTNTQKIIQQVRSQNQSGIEKSGYEQLAAIALHLGLPAMPTPTDAMFESIMLFPSSCSNKRPRFVYV